MMVDVIVFGMQALLVCPSQTSQPKNSVKVRFSQGFSPTLKRRTAGIDIRRINKIIFYI